jgi:hypothetical protein
MKLRASLYWIIGIAAFVAFAGWRVHQDSCGPATFRNTDPHPDGLETKRDYPAIRYIKNDA